jgi:hypothetical protein
MSTFSTNSGAERMRRSRERRRKGLTCLAIQLRATEIEALIYSKLLNSDARNDKNAISRALYSFLEDNLDNAS